MNKASIKRLIGYALLVLGFCTATFFLVYYVGVNVVLVSYSISGLITLFAYLVAYLITSEK